MAKDTDPLTRADIAAGAGACPLHDGAPCPSSHAHPARRRTRPWTLMLFVVEVAIVVALVGFSWTSGSWS
ncbi:hypothetical protein [Sanguibacter suarezii]|uniref:hypothetical protein n=1 Tax=Sanguibacter suarezii TaxID=60921 RepID=UPI0008363ADD|nr:hypothetical protein [Sanguibacter suarezii]